MRKQYAKANLHECPPLTPPLPPALPPLTLSASLSHPLPIAPSPVLFLSPCLPYSHSRVPHPFPLSHISRALHSSPLPIEWIPHHPSQTVHSPLFGMTILKCVHGRTSRRHSSCSGPQATLTDVCVSVAFLKRFASFPG